MGFSKAYLKAKGQRGIPGAAISSCTVLQLADGEVTGVNIISP